jgi:ADP-heptose:LPS heptosyltransferase
LERFVGACSLFQSLDIPVILIGARHEEAAAKQFMLQYQGAAISFVGKLTIPETLAVVAKSLLVFSNDTSPIHMAIATRTPSACVIGGGHFGHVSLYGYRDINHWIYHRTVCFGDNWRCTIGLAPGRIAPCLEAVTVEEASAVLSGLLDYLRRHHSYPRYEFSSAFHGINE